MNKNENETTPKRYSNGEIITKSRMEDEEWYYDSYQPFLEFLMSFYERRNLTVEEIYEGYKKSGFNRVNQSDERILRWSVLHCERHNYNKMSTTEYIEKKFKDWKSNQKENNGGI